MAPPLPRATRIAPVIAVIVALTAASAAVSAQERTAAPAAPAAAPAAVAQSPIPLPIPSPIPDPGSEVKLTTIQEVRRSLVRLPLAAGLGALLALRPRRRGTPPRSVAVVQTQIVLAGVGAVIMLIVGTSLARAFGIVGAANLIRYRSKIDDPKDAVVMLSALAVGLASGVGLYGMAVFATAFLVAALWVIESFETRSRKAFDLKVRAGDQTDELRPRIEAILQRYNCRFELRASSDEEVSYEVEVPLEIQTDDVSNAILRLEPNGHGAVDWAEKKKKKGAA
jgi:uncharacterized membrane protein YhiD involved in acid resistance